ncbi:carboxymuconolactone decarboxylase family protein [Patescibacteria group bacterium]
MTKVKLQDQNVQDPEIKKVFDEIKAVSGGSVPAVFRAFGLKSHILQVNWEKMKRITAEGSLPYQLKESIALAVSAENGCHYCVKFHTKSLVGEGFSEEEIAQLSKAESKDEKTDFVLKLCVKATRTPEQVSDDDFKTLREFGYSDEDILEILTVMEMYTGFNKILVILDLPLDEAHGCCG